MDGEIPVEFYDKGQIIFSLFWLLLSMKTLNFLTVGITQYQPYYLAI